MSRHHSAPMEVQIGDRRRRGVQIFSPAGKPLGIISSPKFAYPQHPANLTFAGKDRQTLYVTARKGLFRIPMKATGHPFPGKQIPKPAEPKP